jgi:hypoxia up-regulated 1
MGDSKAGCRWLLLAVLALSAATAAHASLMAIDLGSEFLKVCLVKPGRTPISIVVNEMSKRKAPALVGLVDEDRVVGEEAFSFAIRYPNTIFSQLRNLLGRKAEDAEVQRILKDNMLLYKVVDHPLRDTCAIQVNETTAYLVEELVVSQGLPAAVLLFTQCLEALTEPRLGLFVCQPLGHIAAGQPCIS